MDGTPLHPNDTAWNGALADGVQPPQSFPVVGQETYNDEPIDGASMTAHTYPAGFTDGKGIAPQPMDVTPRQRKEPSLSSEPWIDRPVKNATVVKPRTAAPKTTQNKIVYDSIIIKQVDGIYNVWCLVPGAKKEEVSVKMVDGVLNVVWTTDNEFTKPNKQPIVLGNKQQVIISNVMADWQNGILHLVFNPDENIEINF